MKYIKYLWITLVILSCSKGVNAYKLTVIYLYKYEIE